MSVAHGVPSSFEDGSCLLLVVSLTDDFHKPNLSKNMSAYKDIFEAAAKGTVEDVKFFVEKDGSSVNAKAKCAPLYLAAKNGRVEIVNYLISAGANVNAKGVGTAANGKPIYNEIPLHRVAVSGNIEIAKILVSNGAKVNAKNELTDDYGIKHKATPHDMARLYGQPEMVRYLSSVGGKDARDVGCLVLLAVLGASLTACICGLALFVTPLFLN